MWARRITGIRLASRTRCAPARRRTSSGVGGVRRACRPRERRERDVVLAMRREVCWRGGGGHRALACAVRVVLSIIGWEENSRRKQPSVEKSDGLTAPRSATRPQDLRADVPRRAPFTPSASRRQCGVEQEHQRGRPACKVRHRGGGSKLNSASSPCARASARLTLSPASRR